LLFARRGLDVLLVDRARFPSEILHGHFIHRHLHLARLGPFPAEVLDRRAAIRGDDEATRGFYLASEGLA
jgi:hypothetical protein